MTSTTDFYNEIKPLWSKPSLPLLTNVLARIENYTLKTGNTNGKAWTILSLDYYLTDPRIMPQTCRGEGIFLSLDDTGGLTSHNPKLGRLLTACGVSTQDYANNGEMLEGLKGRTIKGEIVQEKGKQLDGEGQPQYWDKLKV